MTLPTYSTGTVSVAAGGTVVTGVGGMWSGINVKQGDWISINNVATVLITEVTDSTHLKIAPWPGAVQSGVPYVIYQNYVGRVVGVAAAEDVGDMLEMLHVDGLPFIVGTDETVPDPSYGNDGQMAFDPATGQWWTKTGGVWVPSYGFSTTPFDALTYDGMQVNGSFDVSQERGYSNPITATGYICDGWNLFAGGTAVVSAYTGPVTTLPGFINRLLVAITTAQTTISAGDRFNISQNIEGYRVSRLGWGTSSAKSLTIGFWTRHLRVGTYSVSFRNNAADRSYVATYTQNVSDTWEYKTLTIPGDTTGTWLTDSGKGLIITFSMACGSTYIVPSANTWTAGNYIAAPGQVNGVASTTLDGFRLGGVIVVPGAQAPNATQSPLLMRPFDQELLICQRYLSVSDAFYQVPVAGSMIASLSHKTSMRATPTVVVVTILDAAGATVAPNLPTAEVANFQVSAPAAGNYVRFSYKADARL